MELTANQEAQLVDKTNDLLLDLCDDESAIILIDSIRTCICEIEANGKIYQLQVAFVSDEKEKIDLSC